ncbi:CPBP family intramembrane metalloprotease [Rhodococcus sp. BGS-1C]|jgi:membrane protease YdiL (CAAX protease family)|uniref:CPBP family intramembrane glutamic endopeptidase n=1 Tax=unclassified Rhodococcus (in: high G+C Gram-positive bacteria) TaxID=192944 RepID=UPI0019CFA70C|nr:type II CAAX endopeptidase family protein [Rhodococcus sp. KRD197]
MKPLVLGAITTAWSTAIVPALDLPPRRRALLNAALGIGVVSVSGFGASGQSLEQLGLTRWGSGLRWGAGAAAVPIMGAVFVAAVPALSERVRPSDAAPAEWVLFHIPVGTVITEELSFRGLFDALAPGLSPLFFGLWHIRSARAAGDSVVGTVIGTAAAGMVFSWLRRRSGSVLAPALAHFALNASGAMLAARASRTF